MAGEEIARGGVLGPSQIQDRMEAARDSIGNELERFAVNTLEYVEKEARQLFEPIVVPQMRTSFAGRHVLIVVRGHDYRDDLKSLRSYIHEYHPVLVGVDGGADALLKMGLTPDMIIGDFDSLSERAWACGAELVHHVHPDGRGPGREELQEKGLAYVEFVIGDQRGRRHDARLRVPGVVDRGGGNPLDHGGVPRQGPRRDVLDVPHPSEDRPDADRREGRHPAYRGRVRRRDIVMLVAAAVVVILTITLVSESLQVVLRSLWLDLRDLWYSLTGRLS